MYFLFKNNFLCSLEICSWGLRENIGGSYSLLHPVRICVIKQGFSKRTQVLPHTLSLICRQERGQIPLYMQTLLSFCFLVSMDSTLFASVAPAHNTVVRLCLEAGAHLKYWSNSLCSPILKSSHVQQQIRKSESQTTGQGSRHQLSAEVVRTVLRK